MRGNVYALRLQGIGHCPVVDQRTPGVQRACRFAAALLFDLSFRFFQGLFDAETKTGILRK